MQLVCGKFHWVHHASPWFVALQAGTIKKCNCATNSSAEAAVGLSSNEISHIRIKGEDAGALHGAPNRDDSLYGDLMRETVSVSGYDL